MMVAVSAMIVTRNDDVDANDDDVGSRQDHPHGFTAGKGGINR